MKPRICSGARGYAVLWILIFAFVGACVAFVIWHDYWRRGAQGRKAVAGKVPADVTTPAITPAPVPVETVPVPDRTPEPRVEATPLPPLTLATLAQDRSIWPKEVALTRPTEFPALVNGKIIGSVTKPAGSILRLVEVTADGMQVSFHNAPTRVPPTSTDLLARASRLRPRPTSMAAPAPTVVPVPAPTALAASAPAAALREAAVSQPSVAPTAAPRNFLPASKLNVEVIRMKRSRIEGGDWDDKTDHIRLKVRITNPDPSLATEKLKLTVYVFVGSVVSPNKCMLLGRGTFDFDLAPRAETTVSTEEFDSAYDTNGARWGYKYSGWILEMKNASGKSVFTKVSASTYANALPVLASLTDKGIYDSSFDFKSTAGSASGKLFD